MTIDVDTAPAVLDATELASLDTRNLFLRVGDINTAFADATAAFHVAQDNLTLLLTEQVARHALNLYPDAAMVFVRAAAEYHKHDNGDTVEGCEGHDHHLVPFEVLNSDGIVLGGFDPYSPVIYLMERLSPLIGVADQILDIDTREWALD